MQQARVVSSPSSPRPERREAQRPLPSRGREEREQESREYFLPDSKQPPYVCRPSRSLLHTRICQITGAGESYMRRAAVCHMASSIFSCASSENASYHHVSAWSSRCLCIIHAMAGTSHHVAPQQRQHRAQTTKGRARIRRGRWEWRRQCARSRRCAACE